jgi:hypothetical protein
MTDEEKMEFAVVALVMLAIVVGFVFGRTF